MVRARSIVSASRAVAAEKIIPGASTEPSFLAPLIVDEKRLRAGRCSAR